MGQQIPASFDATKAWTEEFEARVQQLVDDATKTGLALTVLVTYERHIEVKGDAISESSESTVMSACAGQHTLPFMVASEIATRFSDNPSLMSEPNSYVATCLDSIMGVQRAAQNIVDGKAAYQAPVRFENGELVDPSKLN